MLAGCAEAPSDRPPDPLSDARAAFAVVAADAIRHHGQQPSTIACIRPAITASAFDRNREMWLARHGPTGDRLPTDRRPDDLSRREFGWRQSSQTGEPANGPLLNVENRRLLDDAATAVLRRGAPARPFDRVDPAWAAGIPFCRNDEQRPLLGFTAPVIQGDVAFVETGYGCGGLCGVGYVYALRREAGGRWAVLGATLLWSS